MTGILRVYTRPEEIGRDGYPFAWHRCSACCGGDGIGCTECAGEGSAKDLVRALAGHRCVRCLHPYVKGAGEWSDCDEQCRHGGPARYFTDEDDWSPESMPDSEALSMLVPLRPVQARWRILTVHHLTGDKADLRWWNLASLCQRCHLQIQGKVQMPRVWPYEHSEWFKPYAAGWYAWSYLGLELDREETLARLDELLALELAA